jgi:hypothetical protein
MNLTKNTETTSVGILAVQNYVTVTDSQANNNGGYGIELVGSYDTVNNTPANNNRC